MSYEKMMKRTNGHRHDNDCQPILFAMQGEHIEIEAERYCNTNVGIQNYLDGSYEECDMNYDEIK